jgi:hypothetical protein
MDKLVRESLENRLPQESRVSFPGHFSDVQLRYGHFTPEAQLSLRATLILSVVVLFNLGKPVLFERHRCVHEVTFSFYGSRRYSDGPWPGRLRGRISSPGRVKNFIFSTSSRSALGPTQPPIQWVLVALSLGVMRPGREADHSPPTSAEVKKMWVYTSTLHGVVPN